MTECAAHLVDAVLPWVPVRQWVLTLPYRLRYQLAWNHGLSRAVLRVYTRVLLDLYARGARMPGVPGGRTGSVTVIQRADAFCDQPPEPVSLTNANQAFLTSRSTTFSISPNAPDTCQVVCWYSVKLPPKSNFNLSSSIDRPKLALTPKSSLYTISNLKSLVP